MNAASTKKAKVVYEPDMSHREKHRGESSAAQLVEDNDGRPLGKCSNEIDADKAQELLDGGIRWSPASSQGRGSPLPTFVFNTYKGVPYRAHRRGRTRFFHGFPDVKNRIPRTVRDQLRERAVDEGEEDAFDAWMRQTERYD
ncbi:MAG TPA: hypothetical protein PKA88_29075 [Polyangiaceae bacterium]|nr:hypothetical protein [Polyangiaceae bacterium]HMR81093.1 hypothetical protein [Polyangiaceae bacterium]